MVNERLHLGIAVVERVLAIVSVAELAREHLRREVCRGRLVDAVDKRAGVSVRAASHGLPLGAGDVALVDVEVARPAVQAPARGVLADGAVVSPLVPRLVLVASGVHVGVLRHPRLGRGEAPREHALAGVDADAIHAHAKQLGKALGHGLEV